MLSHCSAPQQLLSIQLQTATTSTPRQWRRQDFVTGGGSEVWVYRKSRVRSLPEADTFTAVHTYYIIYVRPPIGGSFPLLPSGGATAPRTVADKLRLVLNAAARVITGTRKFDRGLGQILHDQLPWLDVLVRALVTSASSASGVLNDYALYKSTHSLTHTSRRYNLL